MSISFQYVKWRNFLSTGNQFTTVQLNRSTTTLLVGSNGHGKSTIVDAICFALFNKPFRNINKGQLINSINKKECEVEIGFKIGSISYKVIRGIKPNLFEIYVDDVLLNQDAASKDQQNYLEENILKLNYKSFTQMSILGAANYTPFMQLTAANRREVIEDLLDISVFSKMNDVLKEKIKNHASELNDINRALELSKIKFDNQERFIETLQKNSKDRVHQIDTDIETSERRIELCNASILKNEDILKTIVDPSMNAIQESIQKNEDRIDELKSECKGISDKRIEYTKELLKPIKDDQLESIQESIQKNDSKIDELRSESKAITAKKNEYTKEILKPIKDDQLESIQESIQKKKDKIDKLKDIGKELLIKRNDYLKEIDFFEKNDDCPTCSQSLKEDFKVKEIEARKDNIQGIDASLLDIQNRTDVLKQDIESLNAQYKERSTELDLKRKETLNDFDIAIADLQDRINPIQKSTEELNLQYQERKDALDKERRVYLDELDSCIADAQTRIGEIKVRNIELEKEYDSKQTKLEETRCTYKIAIVDNKNQISAEESYIVKLKKEKNDILSNTGDINAELEKKVALQVEIDENEKKVNDKHDEKKYLDLSLSILKDNGIKTMIIKQYVPIINKLVNSYLQTQDLFVQFELDETFNETIKSRHRDDFSYASFSEGEKARIDISILLAFRSIARMKSTSSTDLLLLDETFDSSIDSEGSDALSAILATLQDTFVFVISHNERMQDKLRNTIKFVKINNYSIIENR